MDKAKVYFRADGSAKIGLGHVYRSLALAEMISGEFECHFIIREPLPQLVTEIMKVCVSYHVLQATKDDVQEAQMIVSNLVAPKDIVVLDGYHFVTEYQQVFKDNGNKLVCIDDIHAYHFVADVVINHAGGLGVKDYSIEDYSNLCLGLEYALLRKPFRDAAINREQREIEKGSVFICLGGADPNNDTIEILHKCENLFYINKCYLILGSAFLYENELYEFIKESDLEIEVLRNLDAKSMVHIMEKCGVAITPPSSVSFEYLAVSGELYLKIIADNQIKIYNYFVNEGYAKDVENFVSRNENKIEIKRPIDGKSGDRFISLFKSLV